MAIEKPERGGQTIKSVEPMILKGDPYGKETP